MNLWQASPDAFIQHLQSTGLRRAWIITHWDTGEVLASHDSLEPLAHSIAAHKRDYRGHEGIFFEIGSESGHLLSAVVHKTRRGQAAGGVRFWTYPSLEEFVSDGLRLSRGMGHKNALAGLWWGGGKGVVARKPGVDHRDSVLRAAVYRDYGRFMTGLQGCYVTAEDAGTTTADMATIFTQTRHTTCIPAELGGSGNPSVLTAEGVVVAMEAALQHLGLGTLEGKTVISQGLGNVAFYMIEDLLQRKVGRVVGADVDPVALDKARRAYAGAPVDLRLVEPGDVSILAQPGDILAPNAVGAILNDTTIPRIQARVVCGAANNQLQVHERDALALQQRGILYVPDFLCNRMGIVNAANEQYGTISHDPAIYRHLDRDEPTGVFQRSLQVFERARQSGRPPAFEAQDLADELAEELHPIWGHRGQLIIRDLVESGWAHRG